MLSIWRWALLRGLVGLILLGYLPARPAEAAQTGCNVTGVATVVRPGVETHLAFTIINSSSSTIRWIELTRPNFDYQLSGSSVAGWSLAGTTENILLTDGQLLPHQSVQLDIWVEATVWESELVSWVVRASDVHDGSGAIVCSGGIQSSIESELPDGQAGVGISSVTVESTKNSAIVRWHSVAPSSSAVSFGLTRAYDQSSDYEMGLSSNHLVVISGLQPGTSYHFQVAGTDNEGNVMYSDDHTFVTESQTVPKSHVTSTFNGNPITNLPIAPAGRADNEPPIVSLETSLARPFTAEVILKGRVLDNVAIARVEYSLDQGDNWQLVANTSNLVSPKSTFVIAPTGLEDGNYDLVIRALDSSGNVSQVAGLLIIDHQVPTISAELVSFGTQPAVLSQQGHWLAAAGVEEDITLAATGGPVRVDILATKVGPERAMQVVGLRQSPDTGLWQGSLPNTAPGYYKLRARVMDGAGNTANRDLHDLVVSLPARVLDDSTGEAIAGASVTVYRQMESTRQWGIWDGPAYGQDNPQPTTTTGQFGLSLPPGTYYVDVQAEGYASQSTRQFRVAKQSVLAPEWRLKHVVRWGWSGFGLNWPLNQTVPAPSEVTDIGSLDSGRLLGSKLPDLQLKLANGSTIASSSWLGRPLVLSFLSTWDPVSQRQLAELKLFNRSGAAQVSTVFSGERPSRVQAVSTQAELPFSPVVLSGKEPAWFYAQALVTHVLIDQTGKIRAIKTGFQTTAELTDWVASL